MYDGGYRPDRGFSKCSRVVGDVMGQYHPHGDTAIYDTLVRLAQPWSLRYPLVARPGQLRLARQRPGRPPCGTPSAGWRRWRWRWSATSTRRPSTSRPTTTASTQEPTVLPARFPNLLVNGSAGIAVGMATNIPPHNLREVAAGVQWCLEHPEATRRGAARGAARADQGPGLPDRRADRRHAAASRTPTAPAAARSPCARSSRSRRTRGRTCLVGHRAALPGQPRQPRAEDRRAGRRGQGRRHRRPPRRLLGAAPACAWSSCSSATPSPRSCCNNLYKHTQLQDNFGANMLALVDGVPRTLPLDAFVRHWVDPPDRGHRPAHPLPAAQGRGARPHPARPAQGARRARRGHRADPAQRRPPRTPATA